MHRLLPRMLLPVLVALARGSDAEESQAEGKAPDYRKWAGEVSQSIQKTFFDTPSGNYRESTEKKEPCFVWPGGVQFSSLVAAARHEPAVYRPLLDKFYTALDKYWDRSSKPPGFEPWPTSGNGNDKYYDDNAWMVLTFLEAYELTKDRKYLDRAEATLTFVLSGWDEQIGGGIWWHQGHKDGTKNTCSTAPAAVGCLRMARYSPKSKVYIDWATKIVDWASKTLQDTDGLFWDRKTVATGEIQKGKLTYNTALMTRAFLGLYRATKKAETLEEAKRIGKASSWFLSDTTGAYRDDPKWSHLLVESDLELYRATQDELYLDRAKKNADVLYAEWKKSPPKELISAAGIARTLWLLADATTPQGKAFWAQAERTGK
jgi:hypothetical protein